MHLKKCSEKGKSGWKWGDQGHCYTGPNGKKQAIRQGVAIEGPDKFSAMASEEEYNEAIGDRELDFSTRLDIVLAPTKAKIEAEKQNRLKRNG